MPTITITEVKISSVALTPKTVNVGQTFKIAVGVTEASSNYKYENAPLLGDASLTTNSARQIRRQIRKV